MNRFLKSFAITAAVALFTLASAGAASAGDRGHGKSYGGHNGGNYYGGKHSYGFAGIFGHLLYGGYSHGYRSGYSYRYKYNYRRGHNDYRRHSHRRHGHGNYQRMGYTQNSPGYAVQKPCHSTYKHGYAHGRKAKIGGTMCYDNYGNSYIVTGSRYVIAYY